MRRRLEAEAKVHFFGYDDLNSTMGTFGISVFFECEDRHSIINMDLNGQREAIHMTVRDRVYEAARA